MKEKKEKELMKEKEGQKYTQYYESIEEVLE